jgi:hypothetical protein
MLTRASPALLAAYIARGPKLAAQVRREPALRARLHRYMDARLAELPTPAFS